MAKELADEPSPPLHFASRERAIAHTVPPDGGRETSVAAA